MLPADATPADAPPPPPVRRKGFGCLSCGLVFFLFGSLLLNCVLFGALGSLTKNPEDENPKERELWSVGDPSPQGRIAVVRVEGVLIEGGIGFARKQIELAMADDSTAAVVVRIDSPGGTITASEELHRLLVRLRDGKSLTHPTARPKTLVVSMGSIAASGGYYIAMPASKLYAENATLTGSIGVYAALPNVAGLADKLGVRMELIKAGGIKAAGSPFHTLSPAERQPWQDMVDHAYDRFLDVVVAGRPKLSKADFRDIPLFTRDIPQRDDKGNVVEDWFGRPRLSPYTRYRADGGTFTSTEAKQYGLIDEVGTLEDAVAWAAESAGVGSGYRVHQWDRPTSFFGLLSMRASAGESVLAKVSKGLQPRVWYLAAGAVVGE